MSTQAPAIAAFRALHESGCFIVPNPWDVGSAVYLHHIGFKALATTSAGMAFSRGLPDTVTAVSRDAMLAHIRELVAATPLPVSADFQAGYADEPEDVAANVVRCVDTGVAGLSIEDATGDPAAPFYERGLAIERIKAARSAIDATKTGVLLTGRCEALLVNEPDAVRVAIDRLVAYADVGADCLFAPGLRNPKDIVALVKAVAPKPVNVIITAPGLSLAALADLGVRRVSVGSALARVAWGAFMRVARGLAETGSFEGLAEAAPFTELKALLGDRA